MQALSAHPSDEGPCLKQPVTQLEQLILSLQAQGDTLTQEQLVTALQDAMLGNELGPYRQFSTEERTRVLIYRCDAFEVLLLGWLPGQTSSKHEHGWSSCVFRVMEGTATEQRFHVLSDPEPYLRGTYPVGSLAEVVRGEAHIVSNRGDTPLVTLHLYAPPLQGNLPVRLVQ